MYDYHLHSFFSDDCNVPIHSMIEAAIAKGIKEIAITDHFDPDYPDIEFPFVVDFPAYHKALLEISEEYKDQIKIIKGLELGIQYGKALGKCRRAAQGFPYDFILGSFHCADGEEIYRNFFHVRTAEKGIFDYYQHMITCLKEYTDYDVLGHINVIDRYVPDLPNYSSFMPMVDEVLRILVRDGKGLEINTSSFRYNMGDRTTPSAGILKRFKDLGGEIVTIGSDAHKLEDVGYKLEWAVSLLKSCGFEYLATFENRIPNFIPLNKIVF